MLDTNVVISLITLAGLIMGFANTWAREARARSIQLADAKVVAEKVIADANALMVKNNQDAAEVASKLIHDAEMIASKLHESADKLAIKMTENTRVSTEAAKGASEAFTEANSKNIKIADLQAQLLRIGEHVERAEIARIQLVKSTHNETSFNRKLQKMIEDTLQKRDGGVSSPQDKMKKGGRRDN